MVLLAATLVFGCAKESDEDKVRSIIKDMVAGAEAKDIGHVKKHIAKEYKDPAGNDYEALKGIMLFYFMQPEGISVFMRRQEVEVKGDTAYVSMRAVISRGRKVEGPKDLVPEDAGGFVFDLTFDRRGGDWLLVSASWRQINIAEAL